MKSKTETQIAKENIDRGNSKIKLYSNTYLKSRISEEHKASCQRFLEFLESGKYWYVKCLGCKRKPVHVVLDFIEKKKDLEQAIKLYDEVGI